MTPQEQTDAIARVLAGNPAAFEPLVIEHQSKVYNLSLRMMGNPADAEDCAQEAFLKAYRFLPTFRGDCLFSSWLYRLTANVCMDALRKRKRREESSLTTEDENGEEREYQPADSAPGPEALYEQKELRQSVQEALNRLPDNFRSILLLREVGGLGYDEIAVCTGLELGTVKSRIARARTKLAKILRADGNFCEAYASDKKEVQ